MNLSEVAVGERLGNLLVPGRIRFRDASGNELPGLVPDHTAVSWFFGRETKQLFVRPVLSSERLESGFYADQCGAPSISITGVEKSLFGYDPKKPLDWHAEKSGHVQYVSQSESPRSALRHFLTLDITGKSDERGLSVSMQAALGDFAPYAAAPVEAELRSVTLDVECFFSRTLLTLCGMPVGYRYIPRGSDPTHAPENGAAPGFHDLTIGDAGELFVPGQLLLDGHNRHWASSGPWSTEHVKLLLRPDAIEFVPTTPLQRLKSGMYTPYQNIPYPHLVFDWFGLQRLDRMFEAANGFELSGTGDNLGSFTNLSGPRGNDNGSYITQNIVSLNFRASLDAEALILQYSGAFGSVSGDTGSQKPERVRLNAPRKFSVKARVPRPILIMRQILSSNRFLAARGLAKGQ